VEVPDGAKMGGVDPRRRALRQVPLQIVAPEAMGEGGVSRDAVGSHQLG
jgi:hypothetical protein